VAIQREKMPIEAFSQSSIYAGMLLNSLILDKLGRVSLGWFLPGKMFMACLLRKYGATLVISCA
jgi:hypothetical protein